MLIAIDIGNTNITIGVYDQDKLIANYRLTTMFQRTSDEYGLILHSFLNSSSIEIKAIKAVIISSVVPKINHSFINSIKKYLHLEPILVGPGIKTGIDIKIDNPSSLGADRLVAAVAAHYTYGGSCIVVDFGTATTFDIVSEKGEFYGAVIAPGIGISAEALSSKAAKLPEIEIKKPKKIIAKNTINSMQAGIFYGYIGLVEYIIKKIKEEYGQDLKVISTGGLGRMISNETDYIDIYDADLLFKGLKIIYEKNCN